MGEVYRARDPRLGRHVAIKVLPERFAHSADRLRRFEREARSAGALSHPNILTVFDVGSQDGTPYLVSELLEGETLRIALQRQPLGVRQSLSLGLQVARGLICAHEAGILHRDLKPENLFMTRDGQLKILDFGLAKLVHPEGDASPVADTATRDTDEGRVVGTAAYMSPEQIRGEPLDERCDIFALGAILFELMSRGPAFAGPSQSDVMASVLRDEPPPLDPAISPAVQAVVRRCLEKRPEDRFGSAREVAVALQTLLQSPALEARPSDASGAGMPIVATPRGSLPVASPRGSRVRRVWLAGALITVVASSVFVWRARWLPTGAAGRPARIVVLPFENLGAPQDTYFAAGLTEAVMSRLVNLRGLSVISRTTALGYDRKARTIPQIGSDLGVDYVLEGTVSWDREVGREGRVRITPTLTQVADDTQVWADQYDRVTADIFAIQSEVAESVVRAMGVKLLPREKSALAAAPTSDKEAYDFYLRGLEILNRGPAKENIEGAVKMFQAAVDRDPSFTQALARLSRAHAALYFYYFDRRQERVDKAKETLDRLSALGPDVAETHTARGFYDYWVLADYSRALDQFKAALLLQPSSIEALEGVGTVLRRQGRWEESAEASVKRLELDPRSPDALFQHGQTCVLLRRYAEADRVLALAESFNPQFALAWGWRVRVQLLWHGDIEKAHALVSEAGQVPGLQDAVGLMALEAFRITLIRRDFQGALRLLENEKREAFYNQFYYRPLDLLRGEAHLLAGENALAHFSFEASRRRLKELITKDPDDPRYQSALGIACAGLGLREEALRAANRAAALMPPSKDHWKAMSHIADLALVHTMLGQQDDAIDRLDFLLSRTGEMSTHMLRLDPRWKALQENLRFRALLTKYGDPPR